VSLGYVMCECRGFAGRRGALLAEYGPGGLCCLAAIAGSASRSMLDSAACRHGCEFHTMCAMCWCTHSSNTCGLWAGGDDARAAGHSSGTCCTWCNFVALVVLLSNRVLLPVAVSQGVQTAILPDASSATLPLPKISTRCDILDVSLSLQVRVTCVPVLTTSSWRWQ
jgi:hypothetical protein